jgi:hypothetical protein
MPEYQVPQSVQANWAKRLIGTRLHPCGEGIGQGLTCQVPTGRLYPRGWRCADCAPPAVVPDPARTLVALQARMRSTPVEAAA